MHLQAENIDTIQHLVLKQILECGHRVQPRGRWVREITGASFQLLNPRARLIYSPARRLSLTYALGELLWYLRGTNTLDIISFYNTRYKTFSDDGATLHGAYGKRLFTPILTGLTQWDATVRLLRADRDTRQAVLHFHLPSDLQAVSRDIPCTCTMQFLIRQGKLECIVMMRSNDIIWGMAYDVFGFTMLQEIMAKQLGVELGTYTHFVGSLHLYDRHTELAESILSESFPVWYSMPEMPAQPWHGINELLQSEEHFRLSSQPHVWPTHPYWRDLAYILQGHVAWRQKNNGQLAHILDSLPMFYAILLQQQVQPRHASSCDSPITTNAVIS